MATGQSSYSIQGSFNIGNITAGFQKVQSLANQTSQKIVSSISTTNRAFAGQHSMMAKYGHAFTRFYGAEGMFKAREIIRGNIESLRDYAEEAQKLAQAQFKFRVIGLDENENQRAFGAVQKTVQNLKGLRLDEVTETITDLHTAFGDLDHAMEHLGQASKFRFGFQTLLGDKFSPEDLERQIQNGFKFLEITGAVNKGADEVEKRFNVMAQMMAATGGRVKASDMLLLAQRGGPALRGLSVEGLRNLSAPMQELGASRTGVSLMSLYQQLVGGRGGGQVAAQEFIRLGLLDKSKVKLSARGLPTHVEPGAYGNFGAALLEDPLKAADQLLQAMSKTKAKGGAGSIVSAEAFASLMAGKPIADADSRKIRMELAVLFGNRMAQGLMDILITQRAQIVKEAKLSSKAMSIQEVYDAALETPMGKMRQFEAAIGNLKMTIGGPLLTAVGEFAKVMTPIITLMSKHPLVTAMGLAFGKLGAAAFQMRMAFAMSGIGGVGAGAAPVAASTGGAAAFNALFTGTSGAAQTTRWYQAALVRNIAALGTLAIAVGAAAIITNEYAKEEAAWEEEKKSQRQRAKSIADLYKATSDTGTLRTTGVGLNELMSRKSGDWHWGGMGLDFWKFERDSIQQILNQMPKGQPASSDTVSSIANILKGEMPELRMSSQIGMLVEKINASALSGDQKQTMIDAIKAAQPKAFAEWEEAVKQSGGNIKAATDSLIQVESEAAQKLGGALDQASEAARKAADAMDDLGTKAQKAWNGKFGFDENNPVPQQQSYHGLYDAPKLLGASYGGAGHTFNVPVQVVESGANNEATARAVGDKAYEIVKKRLDDRHRQREVMA